MSVTLTAPLAWTTASGDDAAMLAELQPNIVKAHVRESLAVLLLRFEDATEGAAFLSALAPLMKSAATHLDEVAQFKASGTEGSVYVGVGLTAAGYAALEIPTMPSDPSFLRGMRHPQSRQTLADPPVSVWEEPYREELHAVVLIGDQTDASTSTTREAVLALMPDSVVVVGEETGSGQRNGNGDGIEHFGYVDGRSQPLFLVEDIERERNTTDGTSVWDPAFALDRVLVPDPASPDPSACFGSYFVFRKLEQNVRRFKTVEERLAESLGLEGEDAERAGALIVGRFEDGTPVTLQAEGGAIHPVPNDFDYDSDPEGAKCPFHAHIRKTNPRGSGGFEPVASERDHLMARRGQTYGERADDPNDGAVPVESRPTGGVGLLFMAFNTSIGAQFDFTQQVWADNPGFPKVPAGTAAPGLDVVIGQGARGPQTFPTEWGGDAAQAADPLAQAVRMRGGEYFFMPSLAFLRSL
ncbi:MAG: hypothetical protein RI885_2226 [Actinomycetota bacterium]